MQEASLGRDGALRPEAAGKDPEALTDNSLKRSAPRHAALFPFPPSLSARRQVQHGGGGDEADRCGGGGLPRHDLPALPGAWGHSGSSWTESERASERARRRARER